MNSDPAHNQDSQWEVDRYLLSDPSLDRDAFEQRMFEDLSLAERVAESVAALQAISSAARVSARASAISATTIKSQLTSKNPTSPCYQATYRWATLVTAAVVLMTVSVWQFRNTSNDDQLSQIADNWVAFESLTTAESLELIATEDQPSEKPLDVETNEESDWLVEAAREFYLAKNDGAAG